MFMASISRSDNWVPKLIILHFRKVIDFPSMVYRIYSYWMDICFLYGLLQYIRYRLLGKWLLSVGWIGGWMLC